jgi:hypothetical protein
MTKRNQKRTSKWCVKKAPSKRKEEATFTIKLNGKEAVVLTKEEVLESYITFDVTFENKEQETWCRRLSTFFDITIE